MARIDKNYVVVNEHFKRNDAEVFFPGERVIYIAGAFTMWDILHHAGLFGSKGQARKNWKRTGAEIPEGFSHFDHIGKRNSELAILNLKGSHARTV
jgi:hypothetical protein